MKALKIIGKIGAGLLGLGGLILAGKTGFGENLKFGSSDEDLPPVMGEDPVDDVPECFDAPDITETNEVEEETSDE